MEEQVEVILRGGQFKMLLEKQLLGIREKYGLKRIEVEVLYFLSRCGQSNTSTDIHRHLKMNKGHISQAVDSLCKQGYLVAAADMEDRRYVHYSITGKADVLIQDMTETWKKINQKVFEGITEEELSSFKETAIKIGKNMERILGE
ncbi:MAG: MarR family winged helix-turn-helix transcriptional regulator [Lachnospiraceae bacterium]|nr:MarR family winged helix-turn-helix transcriptional regulator [Robinsoniella sp.]MDY3767244.1 MarR family winged helix-turn-helix transcriptional regulator [Lachnospiraceae bacterium]